MIDTHIDTDIGIDDDSLDLQPDALGLTGFGVDLFRFQLEGVAYGLHAQNFINGDQMGLGKTLQALAICYSLGLSRFIVICPAAVKLNWYREIKRANPYWVTSVWDAKKGSANCNVIIINYDNLKKRCIDLLDFDAEAIVFDEIHYLKSGKAQRTQAAKTIAKPVVNLIGLSGTAMLSRPSELIVPLDIIKRLDDFGGWFAFAKRYCQLYKRKIWIKPKGRQAFQKEIWDYSGAANLNELHDRLTERCFVRRLKTEVLSDMPVKQRAQVTFEITNKAEYKKAAEDVAGYLALCAIEEKAFLDSLVHCTPDERQTRIDIRRASVEERTKAAEKLVLIETLKTLSVEGKMSEAKEWIQSFIDAGEKLVVFVNHIKFQDELIAHFPNSARIVAKDNLAKRQANIDSKFKSDENCQLMIASLKAGGTGIDGLQEVCANLAFLEFDWVPAVHLQAEDRLHRMLQARQVTAYYLVAENTIEETIQALLAKKQAISDAVLDGMSEEITTSVFDDLLDVLTNEGKVTNKGGKRIKGR